MGAQVQVANLTASPAGQLAGALVVLGGTLTKSKGAEQASCKYKT
ncbi:MAG: hypothetical protein ACJAZ8_000650 [Planctomycetota bacterium]